MAEPKYRPFYSQLFLQPTAVHQCLPATQLSTIVSSSFFPKSIEFEPSRDCPNSGRIKELCAIARSHSSNMAEYGYLSHTDSLGRDFRERLGSKIAAPYHAGENVARNNFPDSARVAVQGWRQSPDHLKNILNEKFAETGIGVAVNSEGLVFFTQIFLGK